MTSMKKSCWFSSRSGFSLINTRSMYQPKVLPSMPKGNFRNFPRFLTRLQIKDNYECINLVYEHDDMDSRVPQNPITKFLPGSAFNRAGDSISESEGDVSFREQGPECLVNDTVILLDKLKAVCLYLLASDNVNASQLKLCHRVYMSSATNLTHYLALQSLDLQQLKEDLFSIGLLDLESINSHIIASINAGIQLLENMISRSHSGKEKTGNMVWVDHISAQLKEKMGEFNTSTMNKKASMNSVALFGPSQHKNRARIMVTVGREAISNKLLLLDILKAGANVIRINCAHDDPSIWEEIIRVAKHSSKMIGKPCCILMDLAGSKLRTGSFLREENVVRISPKKDANSDMISPAQVWLCCAGSSPPPPHLSIDAILCIDQQRFDSLRTGDVICFADVKGRKRSFKNVEEFPHVSGSGYMLECSQTTYLGLGMKLYIKNRNMNLFIGLVVKVAVTEQFLMLKPGDLLTISESSCFYTDKPGGTTYGLTRLTCTSDHLLDSVKPGEPIAFDDGAIWGRIQRKTIDEIVVLITKARPEGTRLGSKKSINIPKSKMQFKGLTPKDLVDLDFVAAHADMVGISFIRDVEDMVAVQHELVKRKLWNLGVVIKVETRDAFERLPYLLFQAMQLRNPLGVMVARGDLMVECGWEQMARIQEDIVSICNIAHIPVIWATQVLESLIKFGYPTRAEITDAAKGMMTSCIMLNKGEHIVEAVSALDSIFRNCYEKTDKMTLVKSFVPFHPTY